MTTTEIKPTEKKVSLANKVRAYKLNNPKAMPKDIAAALGINVMRVYAINQYDQKKKEKLKKRKTLAAKKAAQGELRTVMRMTFSDKPAPDNVNHPAHYKVGGIETIDFIEAKQLNYNLGNVVKYITRADHKGNNIEDLQKARWYLNREIANHTGAKK